MNDVLGFARTCKAERAIKRKMSYFRRMMEFNLPGSLSFVDDDDDFIIHSSCPIHQASSRSNRSAISGSVTIGNVELPAADVDSFVFLVFDAIYENKYRSI